MQLVHFIVLLAASKALTVESQADRWFNKVLCLLPSSCKNEILPIAEAPDAAMPNENTQRISPPVIPREYRRVQDKTEVDNLESYQFEDNFPNERTNDQNKRSVFALFISPTLVYYTAMGIYQAGTFRNRRRDP
ncbi:hypothetical protein DICA1_C03884 [Diutina catenulata]